MKRKKKIFLDDKLTFPFGLKVVPTKAKDKLKDCYYQGNLYVSGYQLCEAVSKINSNLTTLHEVLGIQDKDEKGNHIFIGIYDVDETFTILDEKLGDIKKYSGVGSDFTPTYSKLEKEGRVIEIEVNVDSHWVNEDGSTTYLDIKPDYLEEHITQQIGSSQTLNLMQSMKDTFGTIDSAIEYYKKGLSEIRDCESVVNGFLSENDEEIVKVIKILHNRYQEEHKVWLNGDNEDLEPIDPLGKEEEEVIKVFIENKKKFLDDINSYIKPEFFELFKAVIPPDFRNFGCSEYFCWSLNDIGYGGYRDIGVNLKIFTTSLWFNLASVPEETKEILTKKLLYVLDYLKKKYKEIEDKINSLTEILAIRIPIMVYKIGVNDMIKLANISCNNLVEFVNYDSIEAISEADLNKLDSFKYYIDSQCRIIIATKGEFYKFIPNTSIQNIKSPTFEDHIKTNLMQKVDKELELLKGKTLEHFNRIFSGEDTEEDNMQDQLRKNPDYMNLVERAIDAKLELRYVTENIPDDMKELYVKTEWYMYQYLQGEATNGVLKQGL